MEVKVNCVKFDATEKLEKFIEKKTAKVEKWTSRVDLVELTLKVVKPETNMNKEAQVSVSCDCGKVFASKTCDTFEEAIDLCLEAAEKQIKKAKEKGC